LKGSVSPKKGMVELITALGNYLTSAGCELHLGVKTLPKPTLEQPVVFCGSIHDAADYIAPSHPDVSKQLLVIEMLGLTTTTVFFENDPQQAQGFGCLIPKHYGLSAKGILFSADIFEGRSTVRAETWIMDDMLGKTDDELLETIQKERQTLFGLDKPPLAVSPNRWEKAFPHYTTELESLLKTNFLSELDKDNIYLHGNYLGKLGLADIIFKASMLPERLNR